MKAQKVTIKGDRSTVMETMKYGRERQERGKKEGKKKERKEKSILIEKQ